MHYLSAEQVEALSAAAAPPGDLLVLVLAYGGLRWGEAAALTRRRCKLLRSRLLVVESVSEVAGGRHVGPTKTHQQRAVALPAFLRDALAAHLAAHPGGVDDSVFTAPSGSPLRYANFMRDVWRPAAPDSAGSASPSPPTSCATPARPC